MPLPTENYARLKAKSLDIGESLTLQKEQADRLKEIQIKQAAERLARVGVDVTNIKIGDVPHFTYSQKMAYRDNGNAGYDLTDNQHANEKVTDEYEEKPSDIENDEDETGTIGGVSFTMTEYEDA